jgi:hypothetical protein
MATYTVSSAIVTLSKGSLFAECLLYWHSTKKLLVAPLPVPLPSVLGGTRQRLALCRALAGLALGKGITSGPFVSSFVECTRRNSTKLASLPSTKAITLGKEAWPVPRCALFDECYDLDTRQSTSLLRVTLGKVTSIPHFYYSSKQTKDISHNHHIYITVIT